MAAQESTLELSVESLDRERARLEYALFSANTHRGYGYDWKLWEGFCARVGACPMPGTEETAARYATDLLTRGLKVSTVARRLAVVKSIHKVREYENQPVGAAVYRLLRAARRLRCETPRQVRPLTVENLRAISDLYAGDDTPRAWRNRALLVLGFSSALRSASLVKLLLDDVAFVPEGIELAVWHEKNNQEGVRMIGVPHAAHAETDAGKCLATWLEYRGVWPGPLFSRLEGNRNVPLTPEQVGLILQRAVKRIGLDWKAFGSHSMRAGLVTAAVEGGASLLAIAGQSGHRDIATLQRYFRRTSLFRGNVCAQAGL